ncbi:type II toxin-antitoxin system RelE/ParE family toxin [Lonepinella sp. BR2919]|uniref:type II toxin-antitoxin system RelE/ParE family toxin n=1 Tax=unclassified Lonepinella TaxID=2642006 RepID=UPI003F6DAD30
MIISFKHKGLEKFFTTGSTAGIQASHAKKIALRLTYLNNAADISDMDVPGFNLHALTGNLADHWSIKVSGNWRITFKFEQGHAQIVDYQDYH